MRAGSTIRLAKRVRRRGTRLAGAAAVPHRPSGRPSGRSIRSPVAALGAPAGSRVAPPPGQRRSGQESLHDCGPYFGPHLPPAQRAFPHQRVILRTTWPEALERTGRVLRPTRPQETVCPDAAGSRGANARRDGKETVLPGGGMLEGGQPIRLGTQRNHRPNRPHRYSHFPSDLKVRPPAGGPALGPGGPTRPPGRCACTMSLGAAIEPRDRHAHRGAPGGQRSAK